MPNMECILNDIQKLQLHQKEQILLTLEEIIVLGLQVSQVEQEINIATSFFWRPKILDCISTFLGKRYVDGFV